MIKGFYLFICSEVVGQEACHQMREEGYYSILAVVLAEALRRLVLAVSRHRVDFCKIC